MKEVVDKMIDKFTDRETISKRIVIDNIDNRKDESEFLNNLEESFERTYLQNISNISTFSSDDLIKMKVTWLQLVRLPVHPTNDKIIDLMSYWQNALSTFNVWGNKFIFLLLRKNGETNIFFGVASTSKHMTSNAAVKQIRQATSAAIPGIEVQPLNDNDTMIKITDKLLELTSLGTITGMPSLREKNTTNDLQTLDALAFGFKGEFEEFTDYATLIISEPIKEESISDIIYRLRDDANIVHKLSKSSEGYSIGKTTGINGGINGGSNAGSGSFMGDLEKGGAPGTKNLSLGAAIGASICGSHSTNIGRNISNETINKSAQYIEHVIEGYIEKLRKGRNLGFWNTGVYVMAQTDNDVKTVLGILKSIYSGDQSYIEPIRANVFNKNSNALDIVRSYNLIPYPFEFGESHRLGKLYNYISTPMNTEELSIATSLPRKDVPGIRFSKTAVRFATNPAEINELDAMEIGYILDMGVTQKKMYQMSPDALVRHALVAGCTGSGKSTTCKRFLKEIDKRNIPSLIIEPAKDDYVRWAIEYNDKIDQNEKLSSEEKEKQKYDIYMPGVKEIDGYKIKKLKINPFEPAAINGAPIDLMSRYEQAVTIINASIPASDVLPILIDESIYRYMSEFFVEDFKKTESEQRLEYPKVSGIMSVAKEVLAQRNYDSKVQNDIAAALETRFNYLCRGKRGEILDIRKSTDYEKLFNGKTVINLSRLIGTRDKSLIMSFIIVALYEYRNSAFNYNQEYRKKANENKLLHLTLIEEAHNLLQNPEFDASGTGNPQKVSADMFTNILSEIRSYGQGLIIVDQVPTRLIPDAIKNTNYKIIHRLTAADDANAVASSMALSDDQAKIIPKLKIGETIVFGDLDDAALWVKIKRD